MDLSKTNAKYLKKLDENFFKLIRILWVKAADSSQIQLIRDNYGVKKISNGLTFDNAFVVKATTSILLFLSLSDAADDFVDEVFFNNVYVAVEKTYNTTNYILLARLIRILQINEKFNNWMFAKGPTPTENKVWRVLYDISKMEELSEDIRKETARAVKEGMRVDAKEGQYCAVPPKVVDKLRKDKFWEITNTDKEQLDILASQTRSSPAKPFEIVRNDENAELNRELIRVLEEEEADRRKREEDIRNMKDELDDIRKEIAHTKVEVALLSSDHGVDAERTGVLHALDNLTTELRNLKRLNADQETQQRQSGTAWAPLSNANADGVRLHMKRLELEVPEYARSTLHQMQHSVLGTLRRYKEGGPDFQTLSHSQSLYVVPAPPALSASCANLGTSLLHSQVFPRTNDGPLPIGWEKRIDPRTNQLYYFERVSGRVQWKPP